VLRHEGVADDDILAAGARQATDKPIVLDLDIGDRSRKNAPSCGGAAPGGVIRAPSRTQLEWSQPLANDHLPLST
jgi:hypothetical protein